MGRRPGYLGNRRLALRRDARLAATRAGVAAAVRWVGRLLRFRRLALPVLGTRDMLGLQQLGGRLALQRGVHELLPDLARRADAEHDVLFLAPGVVVGGHRVGGVAAADVHDRRQVRGEAGVPRVAGLVHVLLGAVVIAGADLPGTGLAPRRPAGQ